MNSFDPQKQKSLRNQKAPLITMASNNSNSNFKNPNSNKLVLHGLSGHGIDGRDLAASSVVPPVTVVLEGRSICHRISLHKHGSYQSLARALRQMFVDGGDASETADGLDLSNAVPGHLIAYEDMENDLLLAGDLSWKDFVRVAKRIRILPVKANSRKGKGSA